MDALDDISQNMALVAFNSCCKQYVTCNAKVIANSSSSGLGKGEVDAAVGFPKFAARRAIICNLHLRIRDAEEEIEKAVSEISSG